jgi:hypothetical protein
MDDIQDMRNGARQEADMLNIFAETFRIATFTDTPWVHDETVAEPPHRRRPVKTDRWFWSGRGARRDIE